MVEEQQTMSVINIVTSLQDCAPNKSGNVTMRNGARVRSIIPAAFLFLGSASTLASAERQTEISNRPHTEEEEEEEK